MSDQIPDGAKLFAELYVGEDGEAHLICHTKDDDFEKTRAAFVQFIVLLFQQIDNEKACPFYGDVTTSEDERLHLERIRLQAHGG